MPYKVLLSRRYHEVREILNLTQTQLPTRTGFSDDEEHNKERQGQEGGHNEFPSAVEPASISPKFLQHLDDPSRQIRNLTPTPSPTFLNIWFIAVTIFCGNS